MSCNLVCFHNMLTRQIVNKKKGILVLIVALVISLTLQRSLISIEHVADKNNMLLILQAQVLCLIYTHKPSGSGLGLCIYIRPRVPVV